MPTIDRFVWKEGDLVLKPPAEPQPAEVAQVRTGDLSDTHIQRLLNFQGYGDPGGRFWFIGMEEHGVGSMAELQIRASRFNEIEDLFTAHRMILPDSNMKLYVPVWATMGRIVLRLSGEASWNDRDRIREYQTMRLGRQDGETFLSELLPLPAPSTAAWPYGALYPTRSLYRESVLPHRIDMLRQLLARFQPDWVFCYGKANWPVYKVLAPEVRFEPLVPGKAEVGRVGRTTWVLTPFLSPYRGGMSAQVIYAMCATLLTTDRSPRGPIA